MPRIRLTFTSSTPTPRISIESAIDPPTSARPSRTTTRGGIAPRFTQITVNQALGDTTVAVRVTASILIGSTWASGPLNSALPAGRELSFFWVEGPGDGSPPLLSTPNPLRITVFDITVDPTRAGSWRLGVRYRATGIEGGMEILPFLVKVIPA